MLTLAHNFVGGIAEEFRNRIQQETKDPCTEEDVDWQEQCDAVMKHVRRLKSQGDTFVVLQEEKPVGMVSITDIGIDPNTDKGVYGITRLSVMEEAGGQQLGERLIKEAIVEIRRRDTGVDILLGTPCSAVVHICEKMGFSPITVERRYQIHNSTLNLSEFQDEIARRKIFSRYFLMPAGQELYRTVACPLSYVCV